MDFDPEFDPKIYLIQKIATIAFYLKILKKKINKRQRKPQRTDLSWFEALQPSRAIP